MNSSYRWQSESGDVVAIVGGKVIREPVPQWQEVFKELHGDPHAIGYDGVKRLTPAQAEAKYEKILRQIAKEGR